MWSNTQPHGGLILVGIDDDGSLSGCASLGKGINALENLTPLCPDARWASKPVEVVNAKGARDFILAFRVEYRPDKVVEVPGGKAFIREGDRKIELSEALKRELRISKGEIHYELEATSLTYPSDFDVAQMDDFVRRFFINRRYQTTKSREELLELAKLGRLSGGVFYPNLACVLMFAKDPRDVLPGARIRVIRYEGTSEQFGSDLNAVASFYIDGNISRILFDAKPLIAAQLRYFQRFGESGRIELQPEYPEEAWFEAIVNAVAHRSYNLKTQNIFVKIFDDKLVVESPGGFIPPTTATTVYDAHNPRNPFLMEAMMHLELTFCGFEGTRRMRHAMQVAKLPEPRFRQIEAHFHQVHVTLENDIMSRRVGNDTRLQRVPSAIADVLTTDEKTILAYLQSSPQINVTTAALLTSKSWPTASKYINRLVEFGLIESVVKRGKNDPTKAYKAVIPA